MKKFLWMVLPLLLVGAVPFLAQADEVTDGVISGYTGPMDTTSATTALNAVTTTVKSTNIDLATKAGMFVQVASTTNGNVTLQWSPSTTDSDFRSKMTLQPGSYWISKQNRYVRFWNNGQSGTTVTVKYTAQIPQGGAGGTPSVISQQPWTYVASASVTSATWVPISVSFTASDTTTTRDYRIFIRNEGANNAFWNHNNATTTPTTVGVTLTANTPTQYTQVDDCGYDTNIWVKNGVSPEKVVVDVWKR